MERDGTGSILFGGSPFFKRLEGRESMEKTLVIDGKSVLFRGNKNTYKLYRQTLKRDFVRDFMEVDKIFKYKIVPGLSPVKDLMRLDYDALTRVCWIFARNADPKIKRPEKWIKGFDKFPMIQILIDLAPVINYSFTKESGTNVSEKH